MTYDELMEWVRGKGCNSLQEHLECDAHPACRKVKEVYEYLQSVQHVKATTSTGETLNGWLLPS